MKIEVSNGELIDKYTILQIKCERITDSIKLAYADQERQELMLPVQLLIAKYPELDNFIWLLKTANTALWNIEDRLREKEQLNEFDAGFIELARQVYKVNDGRAKLKSQINVITNSDLHEVKSYKEYST